MQIERMWDGECSADTYSNADNGHGRVLVARSVLFSAVFFLLYIE